MASKLGKALGFGMGEELEEAPPSIPEDVDALDMKAEKKPAASAEVMAMRMFEKASSPEAKVAALKAFGEACGWSSGEDY